MSGRKPVNLTASAGALTVRDRIWAAIRRVRVFTAASIADASGASERTVKEYLQALLKSEPPVLEREGRRPRPPRKGPRSAREGWWRAMRYRLVRDVGVEAPRVKPDGRPCTLGRARDAMWRTVKALGQCDAGSLALTVTESAGVTVSEATAKKFLIDLARGGYVARTGGGRGRQRTRFTFLASRNTGPRAPVTQQNGAVFDPNTGRHAWQP